MNYIIAMVVAFIVSFAIMPLLMKLSEKIGFTDKPNKRKNINHQLLYVEE